MEQGHVLHTHLVHALPPGTGGIPAAAASAAAVFKEVELDAADMVPTDGGGALSFAFSARASSSLPRSTHILNCSTSVNTWRVRSGCWM